MVTLLTCKTCGHDYRDDHQHKCPPRWECQTENNSPEWGDVYAWDAGEAAERHAEIVVDGGSVMPDVVVVRVRYDCESPVEVYRVTVEAVLRYSAHKEA